MKVKIKEKFEATFFNHATRSFEGGSWHARVTIDEKVSFHDIKKIQDAIDQFDHSVIAPFEYIKKEEIEKISKRYTLLKNGVQLADMFVGLAKIMIDEIRKIDEKIAERTILFEFWRDNHDIELVVEKFDIDTSMVEVIEHKAAD